MAAVENLAKRLELRRTLLFHALKHRRRIDLATATTADSAATATAAATTTDATATAAASAATCATAASGSTTSASGSTTGAANSAATARASGAAAAASLRRRILFKFGLLFGGYPEVLLDIGAHGNVDEIATAATELAGSSKLSSALAAARATAALAATTTRAATLGKRKRRAQHQRCHDE